MESLQPVFAVPDTEEESRALLKELQLRQARWATRSEGVRAIQAYATWQNKCALTDRTQKGGSNLVMRCATRLDKKTGGLIVKDSEPAAQQLCGFKVSLSKSRSKKPGEKGTWSIIRGAVLEHRNCLGTAKPKLHELVACPTMRKAIIANRDIGAAGMKEQLCSNEGVDPDSQSVHTLYRAKNLILRQEDKAYALEFQKIRSWCQAWEEQGCGSYVINTDNDHCFVSATVVSDAALRRCKLVGQKVLAVDGMYMKHRIYRGYMMAIEARDGNGESFVLAVSICTDDSQNHYAGLFEAIKAHDVDGEPFGRWLDSPAKALISQCSDNILGALKESLPHIRVLKCCRKLLEEARELGSFPEREFWEIQGATSAEKFYKLLRKMSETRPNQASFLNGTCHKLWAKYKLLEQNMQTGNRTTACFLSQDNPPPSLRTAWTLPPIGALEQVAELMCAQALDSKDAVKCMMEARSIITDFASQELDKEIEACRSCTVQKLSNREGSVKQHDIPNSPNDEVNFSTKTCTCGEWQLHGRPCRHAIKFAPVCFGQAEMNNDPYLWLRFGWDPIYLAETYSLAVETGRDMKAPKKSQLTDDGTTKPPKHFTSPPRLPRKRSRANNSASAATEETCETSESVTTAATASTSTTISKRTGRLLIEHRCANCGVAGHKAHKCPAPVKYEEAEKTAEDFSTGPDLSKALTKALDSARETGARN